MMKQDLPVTLTVQHSHSLANLANELVASLASDPSIANYWNQDKNLVETNILLPVAREVYVLCSVHISEGYVPFHVWRVVDC